MKTSHKGHEINCYKEKCMAGYSLMYYSIFRKSDGYECASGFTTDTSPDPWGEEAEKN